MQQVSSVEIEVKTTSEEIAKPEVTKPTTKPVAKIKEEKQPEEYKVIPYYLRTDRKKKYADDVVKDFMKKRRKEISEKLKNEAKEQQERKAKKLQTLKKLDEYVQQKYLHKIGPTRQTSEETNKKKKKSKTKHESSKKISTSKSKKKKVLRERVKNHFGLNRFENRPKSAPGLIPTDLYYDLEEVDKEIEQVGSFLEGLNHTEDNIEESEVCLLETSVTEEEEPERPTQEEEVPISPTYSEPEFEEPENDNEFVPPISRVFHISPRFLQLEGFSERLSIRFYEGRDILHSVTDQMERLKKVSAIVGYIS